LKNKELVRNCEAETVNKKKELPAQSKA